MFGVVRMSTNQAVAKVASALPHRLVDANDDGDPVLEEEDPPYKKGTGSGALRGKARHSYTVKQRYLVIVAYDKLRADLVELADEKGHPTPSIRDVIARMNHDGASVNESNVRKWLHDRSALTKGYLGRQRQKKSIGSGRKPSFALAEKQTTAKVVLYRGVNRRISRLKVREWVKEAAEVEANNAGGDLLALYTGFKWSTKFWLRSFSRMGFKVRRVSSIKNVTNTKAALVGRHMVLEFQYLKQTGGNKHFDNKWTENSNVHFDIETGFFVCFFHSSITNHSL